MKYFAFGSNMSLKRLEKRGIKPSKMMAGWIYGYRLAFNKKSKKNPEVGWANIERDGLDVVYGVLYWIKDEEILLLDKFEGAPNHYVRTEFIVATSEGEFKANVYVAHSNWISESCKPTNEYLDLLLEGKEFLPKRYAEIIKKLKNIN